MKPVVLLTCEHASNAVPARYRHLFRGAEAILASHRGWDAGSLQMARVMQRHLDVPLLVHNTSRLLIEPNRSLHHRLLFSEFTRDLSEVDKQEIIARYYLPHRRRVEAFVQQQVTTEQCVAHVACHTFTPRLQGEVRKADVGWLYDPARGGEAAVCQQWLRLLRRQCPSLQLRRNYPYLGKADGLTTHLRRRFASHEYVGIELEVNQNWAGQPAKLRRLAIELAITLQTVLCSWHVRP